MLAILGSAATLYLVADRWRCSPADRVRTRQRLSCLFKPALFVIAGACLALSAGTSTGIAIFLRRRWARISILVFAGLLAVTYTGAMLFILSVQLLAVVQNRPSEMAGWVVVGFTGVLAAMGVWWLGLFNRSSSKAYFDSQAPLHERARPLSISVTAWCLLIGAAFMITSAVLRSPAMLFGFILTGWVALVVYGALAAVQMYLGTGLLHLHEKAVSRLSFISASVVSTLWFLVGPGYATIMSQAGRHAQISSSWRPAGIAGTDVVTGPANLAFAQFYFLVCL